MNSSTRIAERLATIRRIAGVLYDLLDDSDENRLRDTKLASGQVVVAVVGGYSTGKTSFLRRVLGQATAAVSSWPQTSSVIEYVRGGNTGDWSITLHCAERFSPSDPTTLAEFARRYGLGFQQQGSAYMVPQDIQKTGRFTDLCSLLKDTDDFRGLVQRVTWPWPALSWHDSGTNLLDYATLCDTPGLGSSDVDLSVAIDGLRQLCPDIVLCLLRPQDGGLREDELRELTEFLSCTDGRNIVLAFVMHQEGGEENWKHVKATFAQCLESLVKSLDAGAAQRLSGYLLIDARGSLNDRASAIDGLSVVLGEYFAREWRGLSPELREALNRLGGDAVQGQSNLAALLRRDPIAELGDALTRMKTSTESITVKQFREKVEKACMLSQLEKITSDDDPQEGKSAVEQAIRQMLKLLCPSRILRKPRPEDPIDTDLLSDPTRDQLLTPEVKANILKARTALVRHFLESKKLRSVFHLDVASKLVDVIDKEVSWLERVIVDFPGRN